MEKLLSRIISVIGGAAAIWFLISWIDVLTHQWNGSPAAWNLFELVF